MLSTEIGPRVRPSRRSPTTLSILHRLRANGWPWPAALYWIATAWFHRWTTETDVTNLRVVHKTGFIKRRTFEMSLDKVESVDVNQSILGRLMNYGDPTIQGVGEGTETISTVTSPLAFRSAITTRRVGSQTTLPEVASAPAASPC
jgi:uncharacterized membrane protein YdbT with pleckstrin-like domain